MKKVVSIVMNNFKNDTRVLKEAITLKNNNFDVKVLALHDGKSSLKEYDSVSDIWRIKCLNIASFFIKLLRNVKKRT